jgi:hypothetical protein
MLHGCRYRIQYGAGAVIHQTKFFLDISAAIYSIFYIKINIYNEKKVRGVNIYNANLILTQTEV